MPHFQAKIFVVTGLEKHMFKLVIRVVRVSSQRQRRVVICGNVVENSCVS